MIEHRLKYTFVVLAALTLGSSSVMACGCDEICKPGEVYSDEAEMCVPDQQPVS